MRVVITAVVAASLVSCAGASDQARAPAGANPAAPQGPTAEQTAAALRAALDHPDRPAEDRERDGDRKPLETLQFFGVAPGQTVADLMAGGGYYSEIVARALGPKGRLYVLNNGFVRTAFRDVDRQLGERIVKPGMAPSQKLDRELEDPGLPAGGLDAVLLFQFYHDTYWQKTDRARMNAAIFAALRPGGVYGVIDHSAAPGAGATQVESLHRMDKDLVVREILAAGFELEAESDLLANPADERTVNVFDPAIRGRTDQFMLRFRKPR